MITILSHHRLRAGVSIFTDLTYADMACRKSLGSRPSKSLWKKEEKGTDPVTTE